MAYKSAAWMYFIFAGIGGVLFAMAQPEVETYFRVFLAVTAFLLFSVLVSETSNSLVNATEGLVLAHQPIDGATYTAAKLTHLLRVVCYLVLGLNTVPALAGLFLRQSGWTYPIRHVAAAFGVGFAAAFVCCAIFGWLIRFVPAPRLKSAGQVAEMMPFLAVVFQQEIRESLHRLPVGRWLPPGPIRTGATAVALGTVCAGIVLGIRCLSGDFLVRVSSIVHGRSAAGAHVRQSRFGPVIARFFGGQAGRAGFEYVARMMPRDWQFRRQLLPLIPAVIAPVVLVAHNLRTSIFAGQFTPMHFIPHVFGIVFLWTCSLLAYGSDYQGAWIFLLVPARAFDRFAQGVHAWLWIEIIVVPHAVLLLLLLWSWGIVDAWLFVAYSAAVASAYLGIELRLTGGVPFGKQPEAVRAPFLMPMLIAGAIVMAMAVGLQYYFVFRSRAMVLFATLGVGALAWLLTRSSVAALAVSIRYHLGLASSESGSLYKEVDV
jgi:hypothetical protein